MNSLARQRETQGKMVKNENDMNHGNSLLKTATSRKFGASKMALTALRSGARPPVKKVKVPRKAMRMDGAESRVSDLTGSIIETMGTEEHAVIKEIQVNTDFEVESSVLGFSLDGESEDLGAKDRLQEKIPGKSIGPTTLMNLQPQKLAHSGATTPVCLPEPAKRKVMEIEKGISISAPSPMSLDRVHVQGYVQEHAAPESLEYRIQQEAFLKQREEEAAMQEAKQKKIQARLKKQQEKAREVGEGFEAQLGDFSVEHVQMDPDYSANEEAEESSEYVRDTRSGKKKSLVKKLLGKIKPKSPKKKTGRDDDPVVSAVEAKGLARNAIIASKHPENQSKVPEANAKSFPVNEIVMNSKDASSVSDLDASGRKFPVNEISTKDRARREPDEEESVSTLGTPKVLEKVVNQSNQMQLKTLEAEQETRQDAEAGGAGPFFSFALGDPSAQDPPSGQDEDDSSSNSSEVSGDVQDRNGEDPSSPPLSPSSTFRNALDAAILEAQRRLASPSQDPENQDQKQDEQNPGLAKTLSPIIEVEEARSPVSSTPISPVSKVSVKQVGRDEASEAQKDRKSDPSLMKVIASVGAGLFLWRHTNEETEQVSNEEGQSSQKTDAESTHSGKEDSQQARDDLQKVSSTAKATDPRFEAKDDREKSALGENFPSDKAVDRHSSVLSDKGKSAKLVETSKPIIFGEPVLQESVTQSSLLVVQGVDLKRPPRSHSPVSSDKDIPVPNDEMQKPSKGQAKNESSQISVYKGDDGEEVLMYEMNPFGLMQRSPTEKIGSPVTNKVSGTVERERDHSHGFFSDGLFDLLSTDDKTPKVRHDPPQVKHEPKEAMLSQVDQKEKMDTPQVLPEEITIEEGEDFADAMNSSNGDSGEGHCEGGERSSILARNEASSKTLGYVLGCSELIVCGRGNRSNSSVKGSDQKDLFKNELSAKRTDDTGKGKVGDRSQPIELHKKAPCESDTEKNKNLGGDQHRMSSNTKPTPEGRGMTEPLLDKHDPYWDTLSTIASTKDKSTSRPVEQKDSYGSEPRPIPVEILMKTKKTIPDGSEVDNECSNVLAGVPAHRDQGRRPQSSTQAAAISQSDAFNQKKATLSDPFKGETDKTKSLFDGSFVEASSGADGEPKETMKGPDTSLGQNHLSRFGSKSEEDSVLGPPSHRSSSHHRHGMSDDMPSGTKRNNRVASLIARFEEARDQVDSSPNPHSSKSPRADDSEESTYSEDNSALILNVTRSGPDDIEESYFEVNDDSKDDRLFRAENSGRSFRSQFSAPFPESSRTQVNNISEYSSRSGNSLTQRAALERMQFDRKSDDTHNDLPAAATARVASPKRFASPPTNTFPPSNRSVSWGYEEIYEPPRSRAPQLSTTVEEEYAPRNDDHSARSTSSYSMGESLGLDDRQGQYEARNSSMYGHPPGRSFDHVQRNLSRTKDFDNSSYIDLENEEPEVYDSYDEEEQALITRTLELSKALLASMTVEDLESDDEMAKSIMSLGTTELVNKRSAESVASRSVSMIQDPSVREHAYQKGHVLPSAGEGSSESPFQIDAFLPEYDGEIDEKSDHDDIPKASGARLQTLRMQRARALDNYQNHQSVTSDFNSHRFGAKTRNHLPRYTPVVEQPIGGSSEEDKRHSREEDAASISSESSSMSSSAPSEKARLLRQQLDDALKASKEIRKSNQSLGSELRDFKSKFYQKNNEIEDTAKHAMGNL